MTILLKQLAEMVSGRLIGNGDLACCGANPLQDVESGEITMVDDPRRGEVLAKSLAMAVVTPAELPNCVLPQIVVNSPHAAFSVIVHHFRPSIDAAMLPTGVDPSAEVGETTAIHPSVVIGADVVIGKGCRLMPGVVVMPRCVIGDECVLFPNVTIYEYTRIANRVVIHSGSVIGANGFGYRQQAGRHVPTAQLGYVRIDNDVEIGACVTIDRGTYGATCIGEGTKIDNQVMIAHNCRIGRHNLLCSQVGIAGSCTTGDYVVLAGQVGLKDHVKLGDHAVVGAQAGVMEDCEGGQVYLGSPATNQREQMQIIAVQRRLPEMRRELKTLRRELETLHREIESGRQVGALSSDIVNHQRVA
jgi:UDP-3-O-[3-hydroxymyristoyl] glucosamine N-acyltransferase